MENINKIRKFSKSSLTLIKVLRTICIVCASLLIVSAIATFVVAATDTAEQWVLDHPEHMDSSTIDTNVDFGFIKINDSEKVETLVEEGEFNNYLVELGANMFAYGILLIITACLSSIFKKLFEKLSVSDSPFSENIVVDVRNAFILLTIMVAIVSVYAAVVVGLTLAAFYYVYKQGVELQKQSDETL